MALWICYVIIGIQVLIFVRWDKQLKCPEKGDNECKCKMDGLCPLYWIGMAIICGAAWLFYVIFMNSDGIWNYKSNVFLVTWLVSLAMSTGIWLKWFCQKHEEIDIEADSCCRRPALACRLDRRYRCS